MAEKWWKECIFYEIYPKSFCDSNGDGIGDIRGIIGKLDYLQKLGVGALWICPMYPSPGYDNGYDISDYDSIDPVFGTMADFDELVKETHARGMRLVIDLVVNHSSDQHPWFQKALKDPGCPERDYYIWRDAKADGSAPNNWGALFGGSAWTQDEKSGQYRLGLFSPRQPDLNWANPALREEVYAVMECWIARGVDGFRMDVISLIAKPEDYSDLPVGKSGYADPRAQAAANPKLHEYLREMYQRVFFGRDLVALGEGSAVGLENAAKLTGPDSRELDMLFQFEHMDLDGGETFKWNSEKIPLRGLKTVMEKWQKGLRGKGWNALFFDNHDQPRMLSRLGDEGPYREASAKMLAVCLMMMQGTPFLYQGDELGMTNTRFDSPDELRDSESLNAFAKYTADGGICREDMLRYISLKSRDNARTPMQWNDGANAGFTTGEPWMKINPNYTLINAQEQEDRADSALHFTRELIALRKEHPAVREGTFELYRRDDPDVFSYLRSTEEETLLVCCNFTGEAKLFPPPENGRWRMLLDNDPESIYTKDGMLAPFEAAILVRRRDEMTDKVFIISRADDLGSSHSANQAIKKVIDAGYIRNVSVMACGPHIEEAAEMLAGRTDVCFGMHTTLNSEWDRVKWGPVSTLGPDSGLVDENGFFLPDPSMFLQTKPMVETIMREVRAQLEKLRSLGFPIRYVDSHMFSEMFVPGLDEAMEEFIKSEGLLDHMYYYRFPPFAGALTKENNPYLTLPPGQYLWISHPSLDTEEMRMTGNAGNRGEDIAKARAFETEIYSSPEFCRELRSAGVRGIRYDEAEYSQRLTVEEMVKLLSQQG